MQAYDPNKVKVSESIAFDGGIRRPLDHQSLEVEPYDRGLERCVLPATLGAQLC